MQQLSRRTLLPALLLTAGGLLASCAQPTGNPDPGDHLLRALAADPMFAARPPGAVRVSLHEDPARYRGSAVFGGAWSGPGVVLRITSRQSVLDVYRFYARRARQTGWTPIPEKRLSNGLTWAWSKRIDGRKSSIALLPAFDVHSVNLTATGRPRSYSLNGSAW